MVVDPDAAFGTLIPIWDLAFHHVENVLPPVPFEEYLVAPIDFAREFARNDADLASIWNKE
jgi:hypothetical protein